jgi:hypothetical protein
MEHFGDGELFLKFLFRIIPFVADEIPDEKIIII